MNSLSRATVSRSAVAALTLVLLAGLSDPGAAQEAARVWQGTFELPTYAEGAPDPNPPFDYFGQPRVNYPYTIRDNLTNRLEARAHRALFLENEYLKCTVLPDVGGHLYSCTDKRSGEEMFYANPSLKLTQIGYRGAWAAFGVEFNFPVSHNWMSTSPVDFAVSTDADGSASAWVGNIDRVTGMQWTVELTLRPGRAALEQRTTLYNRSPFRHRFYWWTNAAVRVWDDSRVLYPQRWTASHGFRDVDTWPVDSRGTDNSVVGNHLFGPVSRFAHGSREPYMAVWHPRTDAGVVHYSSPTDLPAKKVWSFGGDPAGLNWRRALSDDNSAYVEIQAGLFRNQETYAFLEPQDRVVFDESWLPIRGLGGVSYATSHAAAYMERTDSSGLLVRLNVAEAHEGARVVVEDADGHVASTWVGRLAPEETAEWTLPEGPGPVTLSVMAADGRVLLAHTEGVYDFAEESDITLGPVPVSGPPEDEAEWSASDFEAAADGLERDGRLLDAWQMWSRGRARHPSDLALSRGLGRLAVVLKRPAAALEPLEAILDAVSNDAEAWYYLGHARLSTDDGRGARLAWEQAQQFGAWRAAARLELAGMAAREGRRAEAIRLLGSAAEGHDAAAAERLEGQRAILSRVESRDFDAEMGRARWAARNPSSSLLRHERVLAGGADPGLWIHLAADPERILEMVVEYLHLGLSEDALALLRREYPRGADVVTEPAMPHPSEYPLLAYYEGYVLELFGRDPTDAYSRASRMPTTYVFPNRGLTEVVLRGALRAMPEDATAHFLLGSLLLSGGRVDEAMEAWETARSLDPAIPTLHRNMGFTVLRRDGDAARAAALFTEGTEVDGTNHDLHFGRDSALALLGRGPAERADSLLRFPDLDAMPPKLVYHTARVLAAAGRFDEAEALFRGRFFPSEEGGTDVRLVWLEVRVARAEVLAGQGRCAQAVAILEGLPEPVVGLDFTQERMDWLILRPPLQDRVAAAWASCPQGEVDGIPYRVGIWDPDTLGNHRVAVRVDSEGEAVSVLVPWRRRDPLPESTLVVVVDAATGLAVSNSTQVSVGRAEGRLAFEPTSGPGLYHLHYLPHDATGRRNYPTITYRRPRKTADDAWLARHGLDGDALAAWSRLPRATVEAFEAVDRLNSFFPMEVTATEEETRALRDAHRAQGLVLFPEDRSRSIRMGGFLPKKWVDDGPARPLDGDAQQGEFWTFQVGVWALEDLTHLQADVSDLVRVGGTGRIPGAAVSAFNLRGVDPHGLDFEKRVDLSEGEVQPLWFGVPIPEDAAPGTYEGRVLVGSSERPPTEATIRVTVHEGVISAHGDDDPGRLSRLRWLDSRIRLDDELVRPFTPVQAEGRRLGVLGREIDLDDSGFPGRIRSYFAPEMTHVVDAPRDVLGGPVRIVVEDSEGVPLVWRHEGPRIERMATGIAEWSARSTAGPVSLDVGGALDFDGTMEFRVALSSSRDVSLSDVRLEVPVALDVARYMMGMGFKGGVRPDEFDWSWAVENNQDGAWIGDVNAGLQFLMRDDAYVRPLNTNFYLSKPLVMPSSWANGGKGRCRMEEVPSQGSEGTFSVRCGSGDRVVQAGDTLRYDMRLTVTPFKPIDTDAQWSTRYFHRYTSLDSIQSTGANTVNVHHATPINPWINYPFLTPDLMKEYVDEAHARGMRTKFYYTVRELTNRSPELFMLFSLGDEVLSSGPGGGFSWLQEHLDGDYIGGWLVPHLKDAATVTSGVSRWHNFYLEGLDWLVRNIDIDGLYIDDVAFDRVTMKRVRKILDQDGEHRLVDLHSANQFNVRDGYANSANLYMEHFPFIDRLWFGEYFDYDSRPDFWMTELSGIPFGLMGEMLQDGGNPWRGMVYGMTARLPWAGDPTPLWRAWDDFGLQGSRMMGYWVPHRPVRTTRPDVLATSFVREGRTLVAIASWAEGAVDVRLDIDWPALGLDPDQVRVYAPVIRDFQPAMEWTPGTPLTVPPGRGWLLRIDAVRPGA